MSSSGRVRETKTLMKGLFLAEAPRWRRERVFFSDVLGGTVHSLGLDGDSEVVAETGGHPSGLGWAADGGLLAVDMETRRLLRLAEGGKVELFADLSEVTATALNDMIVDEAGRAYVGDIGTTLGDIRGAGPGRMFLVDLDGTCRTVAEDLGFPNGIGLTVSGETLIVAETDGRCLTAFDRDPVGGELSNRRVIAELSSVPDGISVDVEGAVWVAMPREHRFIRVLDGRVVDVVEVPGRSVTSCVHAGPDLRTLVLTTVRPWEAVADLTGSPGAAIEAITVEVPGVGNAGERLPR